MQVQSTVCGGAQRGEWKQDGNLSSGCNGDSTANAVGKKRLRGTKDQFTFHMQQD